MCDGEGCGAGGAIAPARADAGLAALARHDTDAAGRDAFAATLRTCGALVPTLGSPDPGGLDRVIDASPMVTRADEPLPVDAHRLAETAFVGCTVTVPVTPSSIEAARARAARR